MSTENTTGTPAGAAVVPAAPAPGTTEYNAAMVAKARGDAPDTAAVVAPTAATKPTRPANVPEKFWNAETGVVNTEALLASYGELERKQSLPADQTANIAAPVVTPPAVAAPAPGIADAAATAAAAAAATAATAAAAAAAAKPDAATVRAQADAEFAKDGKLSDATYANLAGAGFDRQTVDTYINGQKATAQVVLNGLYGTAGGQEAYMGMVKWAAAGNYTAAEANAFDAAIRSTDEGARSMAVAGLKARFAAFNGSGGTLIKPDANNGTAATTGYRSRQEVTAAMSDPRYQKGDASYHNEVRLKISAGKASGYDLGLHAMQSGRI